jgi:hypothetical protein
MKKNLYNPKKYDKRQVVIPERNINEMEQRMRQFGNKIENSTEHVVNTVNRTLNRLRR